MELHDFFCWRLYDILDVEIIETQLLWAGASPGETKRIGLIPFIYFVASQK